GGPKQISAQVERVGQSVRRDLPAVGQPRNRTRVGSFEPEQAFEQRFGDPHFRDASHDGRIEGLWFIAVDDDEAGSSLSADTTGEEQNQNQQSARGQAQSKTSR